MTGEEKQNRKRFINTLHSTLLRYTQWHLSRLSGSILSWVSHMSVEMSINIMTHVINCADVCTNLFANFRSLYNTVNTIQVDICNKLWSTISETVNQNLRVDDDWDSGTKMVHWQLTKLKPKVSSGRILAIWVYLSFCGLFLRHRNVDVAVMWAISPENYLRSSHTAPHWAR